MWSAAAPQAESASLLFPVFACEGLAAMSLELGINPSGKSAALRFRFGLGTIPAATGAVPSCPFFGIVEYQPALFGCQVSLGGFLQLQRKAVVELSNVGDYEADIQCRQVLADNLVDRILQ